MRIRLALITGISLMLSIVAAAQQGNKIYLDPNDSFSPVFATALQKKQVPIVVTTDPSQADYTASFQTNNDRGSVIEGITRTMNTGMWNSGAHGQVTISIVDVRSKDVVFSYTCKKPNRYDGNDPGTMTSVAECLAKHWKDKLH